MQISYRTIFKDAWQLTIKNKVLWLFGVFASFISLEAAYAIIISQINLIGRLEILQINILNLYKTQSNFFDKSIFFFNNITQDYSFYIIFIIVAVLIILFIWLVFTSQIFIIKSAFNLYHKKKPDTNTILAESYNKFWPVFGVNIITKLFLYAGFLALSLPLLYAILIRNPLSIQAANIFFLIVFTIFAVIVTFIAAYATNFIILKNTSILEAIWAAWQLFSKNIIISLEVSFILFFLKILSLILIFCLFGLAFVPLFVVLLFALSSNSLLGLIMSITLIILAFILITLFINSIFTTFYLASWTITFIKLTEESFFGKLMHLAKKISELFNKTVNKYNVKLNKKEIKKEAKILVQKLEKKYIELKPKVKKQSKIIAKKLKTTYNILEPKLEKKIMAQRKKQSKLKPTTRKKTSKTRAKQTKKPTSTRKKKVSKKAKTKK